MAHFSKNDVVNPLQVSNTFVTLFLSCFFGIFKEKNTIFIVKKRSVKSAKGPLSDIPISRRPAGSSDKTIERERKKEREREGQFAHFFKPV